MGEETVSDGVRWAIDLYDIFGAIITAALAWLGVKVAAWVETKRANEKTGGMLARLTDSVFTAVKSVNQTLKREIKAAKDPASPGGTKVTKAEAERLKLSATNEIKSYWGSKGLREAAKVIGLGPGGLDKFLAAKIEEAVADTKPRASTP